jgi:NAD(P)-dependent dehydrogenase (short-subunit alcohol dehydrogenase family)
VVTGAKTPSPEIEALAKNKQATFAEVGLNLMAAVRATRAALPGMLAAGADVIVMTCSVNARLPDPAVLDYSPAKAGLAGFAKALPKEVGSHGIRGQHGQPGPGRPVSTGQVGWCRCGRPGCAR